MPLFSTVLVVLQFVLIFLLAMPLNGFLPTDPFTAFGLALLLGGITLAIWAARCLRLVNFSVMPEPVSHGTLIRTGPYAYIRHPMYSAVLICAVGAVLAHGQWYRLLYLLVLAAVLYLKVRREEALLTQTYSDYANYQKETAAIIPFVY